MMRRLLVRGGIALFMGAVLLFGGASVVNAKSACSCFCVDGTTPFASLTAGNSTCQNDCAVQCGGLARLQGDQILATVNCLPGVASDCKQGAFVGYDGVNCVLAPGADANKNGTVDCAETSQPWCTRYNGQVPTCTVPLTPKNANIECAKFGGIAAGGTCGELGEGSVPNAYYKSRPNLGAVGVEFTGSYPTLTDWENAVARPIDPQTGTFQVRATDGICYRYGVKYGGAPTYDGFDPTQAEAEGIADGGVQEFLATNYVPTDTYVCLARKQNTCGKVTPPSSHRPTLPARSYSCQIPSDVDVPEGSSLGSICFPANIDHCIASPGTQCCQGGTIFEGCLGNSDCGTDGRKVCVQGQCVANLVCDTRAGNDDYGKSFSERRCRPASEAELAVGDNICSFEDNAAFDLCPQPGQSCCVPRQAEVTSGCASDKILEGLSSAYASFGCVNTESIPPSQYQRGDKDEKLLGIGDRLPSSSSLETGEDRENAYTGGGSVHCLTSDLPVMRDGRVVGTTRRCGSANQVCCNRNALQLNQALTTRPQVGAPCATDTKTGYTCQAVREVAGDDMNLGLSSVDFLQELSNGACVITPVEDDYAVNTQCQSQSICCDASVLNPTLCTNDLVCEAAEPGTKCDLAIGRCLAAAFVETAGAGSACVANARASEAAAFVDIDGTVQASGFDESQFNCQYVASGDTTIGDNKCVPNGCDNVATPAGLAGYSAQCCVPGTGITAAEAAELVAEGGAVTEAAPFSITLSPCIKSGNCGLEDILYTGAQFANFLIQISGAVFLGIFVYGGFLYLTAGTTERAGKGKKMIIQASVAMVLILAAFTFVNFVQQSLIGAVIQNSAQASCGNDAQTANFACQFLAADTADDTAMSEEISRRGCVRNKCPGPENYLCCPL